MNKRIKFNSKMRPKGCALRENKNYNCRNRFYRWEYWFLPAWGKKMRVPLCRKHVEEVRTARVKDGQIWTVQRGYHYVNGRQAHRVIMERVIGRALLPTERVFFRDGNKDNLNPENLLLGRRVESEVEALERRLRG